MKLKISILCISILLYSNLLFSQSRDSLMAREFFTISLAHGKSYEMLDYLTNRIGGRLSGSPEAAAAVEWGKRVMEDEGFDRVFLQEVMVPHWVRGEKEFAQILNSSVIGTEEVPICALGGSIGTGAEGITAEVVEVHNFEELEQLGRAQIEGKIVFYNRPMDPTQISTGAAYGGAVDQRYKGAQEAAKYGAVGVVVRSMTLRKDDHPHTGAMKYDDNIKKIPAAAISTEGADLLSTLCEYDTAFKFHFRMNCKTLPEVKSYNVIGEIRGSEFPDEIILVCGHLDSWDLGDGAHDDGAGCVQAIEVLRLFKTLEIQPKRTLRAVLFMNEENGLGGAKKYAELAKLNNENHIAAIESDAGGFTPRGFGIVGDQEKIDKIVRWKKLFEPYGIYQIGKGHGGADISQLEDQGVTLIGLKVDTQRYFDYHHAVTDTFDKVNKRELELGAATMAVLVYLLSEYGL